VADELTFTSRHPEALHGFIELDPRTLDTPAGVAQGLRALAEFEAFSASLRALLVDKQNQHVADQPLEGRTGQPERLGGDVAHAAAVSEIAALQNTSEAAAARTLNFSVALVNTHPALHEALAAGDITESHARAIVDQAATLPERVAEAFGIEALARLRTRKGRIRTPGEFRSVVRDLRERLHPESITRRREAAREDRRVWLQSDEDGMCVLSALLPAETARAAYERIDGAARAARDRDGEHRTLQQLRADVLLQLCLAGHVGEAPQSSEAPLSGEPIPSLEQLLSRVTAEVVVHIPLAVALGASDDVARLDGYGVIDATTARLLAAAAPTWQRLFTDDEGVPVKLGRSTYRPPAGLVRFIQYRDGTCVVPGCTAAARRSEIDHTIEWQDGGATDAENLALLCTKHHALKSLAVFRLRRSMPGHGGRHIGEPPKVSGDLVWKSLLGEEYPAEPADRTHILGPQPLLGPLPPAPTAAPAAPPAHTTGACTAPPF
jgi:hypothetical protein